ncbi:hypothetical protein [Novosphingobium pentaromativorans]|uniref:Uncharacterized protein n=1 Tax=Novosphingobium pentaromativorans US6-1 TaxID=1088721 RepID=G6E950_9SPHN|nr:hypothetical protein [Novosphingobium pentaromativorans]AIT81130.1 hypothetical protein JI59_15735 [Novosphingobium pentaromativorans US6-1]EHJ62274.1 hypothetical protein NSU_0871 [Novosphingobium pentaromativorans US6-1]
MILARSLMPLALAIAPFAGAGSALAYDRLPTGLAQLTPDEVREQVEIHDDPASPHVLVSTHEAWDRSRTIGGAHARDVHLKALVDRQSGAVRWQVWHELVHPGPAPRVVGVKFEAGGQPAQADLLIAEAWNEDCPPVDAIHRACNRHTRLVFELPEYVVSEIAEGYTPESRKPWQLKFKAEDGKSIRGGLAPAEAAGLLDAVETLRRALPRTLG